VFDIQPKSGKEVSRGVVNEKRGIETSISHSVTNRLSQKGKRKNGMLARGR